MDSYRFVCWRHQVDEAQVDLSRCLEEAECILRDLRDEVSKLEVKLQVAESALEAQRPTHGT